MRSVISILPVHGNVVHVYLLLLWAQIILAPLDCAAAIRAGVWEVMGAMLVGKANDAPTLSFRGAEVMWCLAVFVEMTRYLAVVAGMAMAMAGETS
jgi:hypothetical protein